VGTGVGAGVETGVFPAEQAEKTRSIMRERERITIFINDLSLKSAYF
jgi:hypothetical protein